MLQSFRVPGFSRRVFLGTAAAAAGASLLPADGYPAKTRYVRYNATSPQGKAMLASYAVGIEKLLKLPPQDARNWFRTAFTHVLDCPHGNWWFLVWHRGFLGYFEQTVRELSGNPDFAFPYWDWTANPTMPAEMFQGVLNPTNAAFGEYSENFTVFTDKLKPHIATYYNWFNEARKEQMRRRDMQTVDSLWTQIAGNPTDGGWFATRANARYMTAQNPTLDAETRKAVSWDTVKSALLETSFYDFNSSVTANHQIPPPNRQVFSILEGQPHNLTHNYIGGYLYVPNVDLGWMTNNLSPVDPVFFLHHSNMDRLWDVWTRRQQLLKLPFEPDLHDRQKFNDEAFLFYVNNQGVTLNSIAGEFMNMSRWGYSYEPGSGEELTRPTALVAARRQRPTFAGTMSNGAGKVALPSNVAAAGNLIVSLTIPHPMTAGAPREYDVLVNAPAGTTTGGASSPYYVATISFFGFMAGMQMNDVTFKVPLAQLPPGARGKNPGDLTFTVVPAVRTKGLLTATARGAAAVLKDVTVTAQ